VSNPFLEGHWIDHDDCYAFNRFGRTLAKLGVVTSMWMEYEEIEELDSSCRCGSCVETWTECGVAVMIGDEIYEEYCIR